MDPVVLLDDGCSYKRSATSAWLAVHDVSPITEQRAPEHQAHRPQQSAAQLVGGHSGVAIAGEVTGHESNGGMQMKNCAVGSAAGERALLRLLHPSIELRTGQQPQGVFDGGSPSVVARQQLISHAVSSDNLLQSNAAHQMHALHK